MAKHTAWRRKKKVINLDGNLNTAQSFAIIGSRRKFTPGHHAYNVYHLLQELGAKVYLVAADLPQLGKVQVYPNLADLPELVDVIIPCLPETFALGIAAESQLAGIKWIWFQPKTLSKTAKEYCTANQLKIIEGCCLKYSEFEELTRFFRACFWHARTAKRRQSVKQDTSLPGQPENQQLNPPENLVIGRPPRL